MGAELRVDFPELKAAAARWSGLTSGLAAPTTPWPGQPFQPTTAAVAGVHTALDLAAAALTSRTTATIALVATGADHYDMNEATAAGEFAGVVLTTAEL
ncbi:hypothetical protein [Mycobacterium sp. Z3061]|uniref:hypothetical protein n=1 Tax=Mycobacterium sp. Z3061 TaxID=3073562 RepID=UPI00287304BB|nr:hypothetical protein [Mycobacterium sp. Z3061]